MKNITIEKDAAGQRLDRYLLKLFNASSRANVYRLIRKRVFKINGKKASEDDFLNEGDLLTVYLADDSFEALIEELPVVTPEDAGIDIVHEQEDFLIVFKPSGLLTHPTKAEYKDTLATKVLYYLREYATRTFKPAPIQRLDVNTSGLVLFAKTYEAAKALNEAMRKRQIGKYYLTIVAGEVAEAGEVKGYLVRDLDKNKSMIVSHAKKGAKSVHTRYRPIKSKGGYTLLEVELLTGRTHQIRASMTYAGYPILGDQKYGGGRKATGQYLEAYALEIEGRRFSYISPDFEKACEELLGEGL